MANLGTIFCDVEGGILATTKGRIDIEEKVIKFTNYIRESDGLT